MTPDEQLSSLLKQCRGIEPSPGFEDAVWRQLHTAPLAPVSGWRSWMIPLAVAAGVMLGIGIGFIFPAGRMTAPSNTAMVNGGSLTGAYLAFTSGGDH